MFNLSSRALLVGALLSWTLVGCQQNQGREADAAKPASAAAAEDAAAPQPEAVAATSEPEAPEGQLTRAVVPTHYALNLTIVPTHEDFSGRVTINVEARESLDAIYLHGNGLTVPTASVKVGDRSIDATYEQVTEGGLAKLTLAETLPAGDAVIDMRFTGQFNQSLEGLYSVTEAERDYVFTQFEAVSARLAFPGFDDPQFKTTWDISVTAEPGDVVITSTPQTSVKSAPDGLQTRVFQRTQPMPTYLLAFAVGPMDVVEHAPLPANDVRERTIPLRGAAAKGKGPQLAYALENTAPINLALENYFGVEYPYAKLDIIAAPDFAAGAMENVGAIIYREQLLLLDENAPLSQRRWYGLVHAHELAHQWFGNLVTPEWWSDIWLNEAFATWMATKAANEWNPELAYDRFTQSRALRVMATDSLASARQIRQPVRNNDDIANAFDGITYSKGGGVLAMFESYLGEARFRDGVRLHMDRFRFDVASSDDFMRSLADGSGEPAVVPAFRSFLDQPGVPQVDVAVSCEDDGPATATLSQQRYRPLGSTIEPGQTWQIPVCLRLVGAGEADRACTLLTKEQDTVELPACPQAVMPNADGAGYYRWAMDADAMRALLAQRDALSFAELLSMADSVDAGYRAGALSAATVRETAEALATHENWEVATALVRSSGAPYGVVVDMHDTLATEAERAQIKQWITATFGPRLDAIGITGDSEADKANANETTFLRNELVPLLALVARDAELRAELAEAADAYVGDSELDKSALNPNVVNTALRVAVQEQGAGLASRLRQRLADSTDAIVRQNILDALARAPQPQVAADARDLALLDTVRDNETTRILRAQFAEATTRPAAWDWLRGNFEPVLARTSRWNQGDLIALTRHFCSDARQAEVETFFKPLKDDLQGGPREYALTTEQIALCTALKANAELGGVFASAEP